MIRIAILSEQIAAQLRCIEASHPPELENIEVVWSGTLITELKQRGAKLRPQVLVVELTHLSEPYRDELDALLKATEAELVLIPYSFARREVIRQVSTERTRTVKIPVSLANLRLSMLSLLVRDAFHKDRATEAAESAQRPSAVSTAPSRRTPAAASISEADFGSTLPVGSPRLFTPALLGRLQELSSTVRCECPNHLAELCTSLIAFEEYSKQCENRKDADSAMHAKLYRETSRARRLLEEALLALCRYEGIEL